MPKIAYYWTFFSFRPSLPREKLKCPVVWTKIYSLLKKIDIHTHLLPERLPDFAKKFGYGDFIYLEHRRAGFADMMKGGVFFREIARNCWDPAVRTAAAED